MNRAVIGVCAAVTQARWRVWDQRAALLSLSYLEAIQAAGGLALMLPPDPELGRDPDQVLDLLDGLVLAGGSDIDPARYGAERHPETRDTVPERDAFEIALARRAWERDLPLLGICRGMQLINVARGGTLIQHLPDEFGHGEHCRVAGSFENADHDVRLTPGSLAARAAGEELHVTKSHHHQGVARLGEGLKITGRSTLDELPEAIEAPSRRFLLGVQWHPEADEKSRVVAALVGAARAYRAERAQGSGAGRGGQAALAGAKRDGRDASHRDGRDGAHRDGRVGGHGDGRTRRARLGGY
jgi:putative glutamine amidotransferase